MNLDASKPVFHSTKYRLYAEPIRMTLSILSLNYFEVETSGKLDEISLIFEKSQIYSGFSNIMINLAQLWFESRFLPNEISESELNKIQGYIDQELKNVISLYEALCNAIVNNTYDFVNLTISQYYSRMEENQFLAGKYLTPLDIIMYEILHLLELLCAKPKEDAVYKYLERVKVHKDIQKFTIQESHYRRPITYDIPSLVSKRESVILDNIKFIEHLGYVGGLTDMVGTGLEMVKVNVLPRKINRREYEQTRNMQKVWCELLNKMARDFEWVAELTKEMFDTDPLYKRFLEIARKAKQSPFNSKVMVCQYRNDFMYHSPENRWIQIENNTLAAGGYYDADAIHNYHKTISNRFFAEERNDFLGFGSFDLKVESLAQGFNLYGKEDAYLLIIADYDDEDFLNVFATEEALFKKHGIKTLNFKQWELAPHIKYDESSGKLYVKGKEIGLVFFESGYSKLDFPNEDSWKTREYIEISSAIKCPPITLLIIDQKPAQYQMTKDENLARYIPDAKEREDLKYYFAKFWDFLNPDNFQSLYDMVEKDPMGYVLKPPGDGGGHNFFGENMLKKMKGSTPEELKKMVLMQRIKMSPEVCYLLKQRQLEVAPCTSEIGYFGMFISDENKMILNEVGGFFTKTKKVNQDEAGLSKGGALDSFAF